MPDERGLPVSQEHQPLTAGGPKQYLEPEDEELGDISRGGYDQHHRNGGNGYNHGGSNGYNDNSYEQGSEIQGVGMGYDRRRTDYDDGDTIPMIPLSHDNNGYNNGQRAPTAAEYYEEPVQHGRGYTYNNEPQQQPDDTNRRYSNQYMTSPSQDGGQHAYGDYGAAAVGGYPSGDPHSNAGAGGGGQMSYDRDERSGLHAPVAQHAGSYSDYPSTAGTGDGGCKFRSHTQLHLRIRIVR